MLSRFGIIKRERYGKLKKRVILDVRQSNVKFATTRTHRIPLPRGYDVTLDILGSLGRRPLVSEERFELMVLDFSDAFWCVPLAPSERRFFVGVLRVSYYVYQRAAQGFAMVRLLGKQSSPL